MKKSILVLSILLFLLMLTCVYQKAYLPYLSQNNNAPDTISISPTPLIHTTVEKTADLKLQEKEIPLSKTKVETFNKPIIPIHTETNSTTGLKLQEKEIPLSKIQPKVLDKPIRKQKTLAVTTSIQNDIEEINTLIQALKKREEALRNRAEFELHIQQLIKRALNNRSIAIAHMNKEELYLLKLQKELLKTRDIAYDKIGQTNTSTLGE